jgi:hypothetical protein
LFPRVAATASGVAKCYAGHDAGGCGVAPLQGAKKRGAWTPKFSDRPPAGNLMLCLLHGLAPKKGVATQADPSRKNLAEHTSMTYHDPAFV